MKTACTVCGQNYEVDDKYAEEVVECTKCGELFVVSSAHKQDNTTASKSVNAPAGRPKSKPDTGSNTNQCKYCGEKIPSSAQKCRFCSAWIGPNVPMIQFFAVGLYLVLLIHACLLIFLITLHIMFRSDADAVLAIVNKTAFFFVSAILWVLIGVPVIRYARKNQIPFFNECVRGITKNFAVLTVIISSLVLLIALFTLFAG